MFQILKTDKDIDFMRFRGPMGWISVVLVIASFVLVGTRGLNMGLDFTGGTLVELEFSRTIDASEIRDVVSAEGFESATVQNYGSSRDMLVRLPPFDGASAEKLNDQISSALKAKLDDQVIIKRTEFVGPVVGKELMESALLAMVIALISILIYVALRFEWRLAAGAVVALFHDVSLIFGFYALSQVEFNLTTVAGVLSVIGYSLNDTIVVFDRIRENFRKIRKHTELQITNSSLTQTLSRTIITSFTTLVVLFALNFAGGEMLATFSDSLIVGVLVGSYSSIYIATTAALKLGLTRESLIPEVIEKEGADQETML
ncbi:protein translocase subunit SecF [Echinimonas agarilytica]|uniref:Protein-export membrane protein SecF n=1 Tax=Echinimonas agarilytica TaxID=1215918 RepID=A0AA42B8F5_9GAMM|nr:protein translocase subunit SecF [Echinimonas agarilytica]MCM2680156.1 protein translocase subunit SecF [Echinimonas agarilytica]